MYKIISNTISSVDPYISVVVTAYNRKEFIKEAVQSAIDQTLDRSNYEIIVVKNYLDNEVDEFLRRNNVLNLYSDEKQWGQTLRTGIESAHGEIICFLDDDDIFLPYKLKEVFDVFQENIDVAYFKHEVIRTRDVESPKIRSSEIEEMGSRRITFYVSELASSKRLFQIQRKYGIENMSSVCIRKSSYLPVLRGLNINQMADFYFFFLTILTDDQSVVSFEEKPLSVWRTHESWTQYGLNITKEEFLRKNLEVSKDVAYSYENFIRIASSLYANNRNTHVLLETLNIRLDGWRVKLDLGEGKRCKMKEIISLTKSAFYLRDFYILFSVPLAIFSFLNGNLAGKIFRWGLAKTQFAN